MEKYDRDAPFEDPVVRCTECSELLLREVIHKLGMCSKCGNKRMRNVLVLSVEEMQELKDKNIDPEFLKLFEGVE